MPGFMSGIHVLDIGGKQDVDGRDKPGHGSGGRLPDGVALRRQLR